MSKDIKYHLPKKLKDLLCEINKSKYILNLKDDFDDEGSEGYSFEVWQESIDFIILVAKHMLKDYNLVMDTPHIDHGPNGSIDIFFDKPNYSLLINISKDLTISYDGEIYDEIEVDGDVSCDDSIIIAEIVYMLQTGIINE